MRNITILEGGLSYITVGLFVIIKVDTASALCSGDDQREEDLVLKGEGRAHSEPRNIATL